MKLTVPERVRIQGEILTWDPVRHADGYNIHKNGAYVGTVFGLEYRVNSISDKWTVSAFKKESHSPRSNIAEIDMDNMPCAANLKNDAPDFVQQDYQLVFSDHFNTGELDPLKWQTSQPWGPNTIVNNEQQYYVDTQDPNNPNPVDPFSFGCDTLIITADNATPDQATNQGQSYTSGVISTFNTFRFQYGYFEWCFKTPCDLAGYWAAFWSYAANFSSNEIDVSEVVGNPVYGNLDFNWQAYHHTIPPSNTLNSLDPNRYNGGAIQSCDGQTYDANNGWNLPPINCGQFNTAGVLWEADRMIWYVNGVEVNSICDPERITDAEMYLIANLAVGGILGGTSDPNQYPAELEIDYIRVYQRP